MSATRSSASSTEPAVSLRGVAKSYTVWADPSERILAPMRKFLGLGSSEPAARSFTAVRDVSLDIMPGECLGIIGRNGAGKSTLLQMIAGTLRPSAGAITVNGRVAALLELGSGFNPDFTGRENVHLYAAVMGLSREEIEARYEAIQAYAGIGPFIDQPVRTYSTGMAVRLAFAVCAHVDADILIIDEALAVGDARFQFKCHATLEQMQREGRTIIFVSHDTNAVKRMCRTAVLLEAGEVLLKGDPNEVVNLYTKLITSPHGLEGIRADLEAARQEVDAGAALSRDPTALSPDSTSAPRDPLPHQTAEAASLIAEERAHRQISDREYAYGGEAGHIVDVAMTDEGDRPRLSFISGSTIHIRLVCEAAADVPEPIYALTLKDIRGQEVFGTNTYFQDLTPPSVPAGGRTEVRFEVKLNLLPGVYFASVGWVRLVNGEVVVVHRRYDVLRFDVMPRDRSFGIASCPTAITVGPVSRPS